VQFPQYAKLPFFVTGESYAGHYIPAVSYRILNGNQKLKPGYQLINLQGLAIGNGLVWPEVQYGEYLNFAYENQKISKSVFNLLNPAVASCQYLISINSSAAMVVCNGLVKAIQLAGGNFNIYNINLPCPPNLPLCYDFSAIDKLMAQNSVQQQLGVNQQKAHWTECNNLVHVALFADFMTNCAIYIPPLLDNGIRVLVYSGTLDFICNWFGGRSWSDSMPWNLHNQYNNTQFHDWNINGQIAGTTKTAGNFTFLGVFNAGHLAPMDQPQNTLLMINSFTADKPF